MSDVLELQDAIMSWISKPQAEFLQILDFNFKSLCLYLDYWKWKVIAIKLPIPNTLF